MKVGDLVKPKPGTIEGPVESLGVGLVVSVDEDLYGAQTCYISWTTTTGNPWFAYSKDLILISENVKNS